MTIPVQFWFYLGGAWCVLVTAALFCEWRYKTVTNLVKWIAWATGLCDDKGAPSAPKIGAAFTIATACAVALMQKDFTSGTSFVVMIALAALFGRSVFLHALERGQFSMNSQSNAQRNTQVNADVKLDVVEAIKALPNLWKDDERGEHTDRDYPLAAPQARGFIRSLVSSPVKMRNRTPDTMPKNFGKTHEPRIGIMAHYDESSSDDGAIEWLLFDPNCKVSYNDLRLDDGTRRQIAPEDARAWHAGVCQPSDPRLRYRDANSAFYGYALAANHREKATPQQVDDFVRYCVDKFRTHHWPASETWRIVAHRTEAWPRGRKDDPDGKLGKVLDLDAVRVSVAQLLNLGADT